MSHHLIGITLPEVADVFAANGSLNGVAKVSFLTELGLTAIVAPTPKARFTFFPRQQALRGLLEVQRTLEAIAAVGPLLAARPGTLLENESEALDVISGDAPALRTALEEYGSARQFQVTVSWDGIAMVASLRDHADMVAAVASAAQAGKRAAGKALQEIMIGERGRLASVIFARLSAVSRALLELPQDGEECIANLVVLIDGVSEASLDAALSDLDALLPGDSRIRCVGPLPALSFAAISLDRIDPDRIDAARRLLGIGHRLTTETVRSAWRGYARMHHPDVAKPPAGSSGFADAAQAHRLLRRYVEETERSGYAPAMFIDIAGGGAETGRRAA